MKRIFAILISLVVLASFRAAAIPACPYPVRTQQPDGSYVTLRLYGDEFHHWTTMDGVSVRQDAAGFWCPASSSEATKAGLSSGIRMTRENAAPKTAAPFAKGKHKFLVLLIEFTDLRMTYTKEDFLAMMNDEDYTRGGATGSAKNFCELICCGIFKPYFVVVGPIRRSKSYTHYGQNTADGDNDASKAAEALKEACEKAYNDGLVDFADYAAGLANEVPMVFFFYAGFSEAEGASVNTIWPHAWYISSAGLSCKLGDIVVDRYACTSELRGNAGKTLAGIGPFCHEFSHVLGLWDLYDTDRDENGRANDMRDWSLMCDGSYLNSCRTPPSYLAVERVKLGWMDNIPLATGKGECALDPIYRKSAIAIPTTNSGETFVCEYRDGKNWDASLPSGLVIYHFDVSNNNVHGASASTRWENGRSFNAYSDHPCCYLVMKDAPDASVSNLNIPAANVPFPGSTYTRTFSIPDDWNGGNTGYVVSNIRESTSGNLLMTLDVISGKKLVGSVYDVSGNPVAAASVSLRLVEKETKAAPLVRRRMTASKNDSEYYAEVSDDGRFEIDLSGETESVFEFVVSCPGYISSSEEITLVSGLMNKDVVLSPINYSGFSQLSLFKYKPKTLEGGMYVYSWTGSSVPGEYLVSIRYSSNQLSEYEGCVVDSIIFISPAKDVGKVYACIQQGENFVEKEAVDYKAEDVTRVDVSDLGIKIGRGDNIFFGYHVTGNKDRNFCNCTNDVVDGGMYYSTGAYWQEMEDAAALIVVRLSKFERTLDSAGINAIAVADSYTAGSTFNFALLSSASATPTGVVWKYDGEVKTGPGVTLTAGEHLVEAVLTYKDGTVETLEQWIKVQ